METVPTHFVSRDGSGLYGMSAGFVPASIATCLYKSDPMWAKATAKDSDHHKISQLRPIDPPAGHHSFLCVPITNFTAARWRNDVMNSEAKRLGLLVVKRFKSLQHRCDLHAGLHEDCLHFDWNRDGGQYLRNVTLQAFHDATIEAHSFG